MKSLLLAILFACRLAAQTTIADTLLNAQLKPVSGILLVEWQPFTSGGNYIAAGRAFVPIVKGVLSVGLAPADYTVTYAIQNYTRGPETWHVCASGSPISITSAIAGSCGGGGGALSWAAVTSGSWAALNSGTWASLVH